MFQIDDLFYFHLIGVEPCWVYIPEAIPEGK